MSDALEQLVDSLLYEGYALYPYTPGATKNATPTPFGIVYPPAYAAGHAATFDHLGCECVLEPAAARRCSAEVRFLQPSGRAPRGASQRRVDAAAGGRASVRPFAVRRRGCGCAAAARASATAARVALRVENRTEAPSRASTAPARCAHSLLSTHPLLRVAGGRFVSPLERAAARASTPARCSPRRADDVVLGAAIVLPDHPQIAPESRGSLFDSTEIEEALLLHVQALSDDERARDRRAATRRCAR